VLILLSVILVPLVILASWNDAERSGGAAEVAPKRSVKTYFALLLTLEAMMIGVFAATDVFLFYVFFEAMLIPVYFIIGSYGGPQRSYAAVEVPALLAVRRPAHARRGDLAVCPVGPLPPCQLHVR